MGDKEFLIAMIEHHQSAIDMSKKIPNSSRLAAFADNIIKVQSAEIEKMKGWLKKWFDYDYKPTGKMKM